MRKIIFATLLFGITLTGFGQERPMTNEEKIAFKKEVVNNTKDIKTLSADFVQYKNMSFMSKEIESNGQMKMIIPNKLLWKYNAPFVYSIAFTDNKITINDQGKKNKIDIGNNKKFAKINTLIVGSISGNMFDENEFSIKYFNNKNTRIVKLMPLSKEIAQYISEIVLYFNEGQNTVSEVKMIEPSKDYTRIIFSNIKINSKIDEKIFTN